MTMERETELESAMYTNCLLLGLDPSIIGSNRVRFVELLWQLSLHALREVHRRTYAADVVLNPLRASLTDVAFSHAATLLPVTKLKVTLDVLMEAMEQVIFVALNANL
ncbi:augmin subunit 6 [Tanacetum coccineum]